MRLPIAKRGGWKTKEEADRRVKVHGLGRRMSTLLDRIWHPGWCRSLPLEHTSNMASHVTALSSLTPGAIPGCSGHVAGNPRAFGGFEVAAAAAAGAAADGRAVAECGAAAAAASAEVRSPHGSC